MKNLDSLLKARTEEAVNDLYKKIKKEIDKTGEDLKKALKKNKNG